MPNEHLSRHALYFRGLTARLGLLALSLSLTACTTLGPDFALPEAGWEDQWQSDSLADVRLGQPTGNWWEQFEDPALTAIVTAAEANNNNVKIAGLRVLEARAQLGGAEATRLPQLVVGSAAAGYGAAARGNQALGNADFLFGNVGAQVGWELDLWGRFRRAIEGSEAAWLASEAARHDVIILVRAEAARLLCALAVEIMALGLRGYGVLPPMPTPTPVAIGKSASH